MESLLRKLRDITGCPEKLRCLDILCRKCRRELIIHAVLQLLHPNTQCDTLDELTSLNSLYSGKSFSKFLKDDILFSLSNSKAHNVDKNFLEETKYAIVWLLALERDSIFHYTSIWREWAASCSFCQKNSCEDSLQKNNRKISTHQNKNKECLSESSLTSWINLFSSLKDQGVRSEILGNLFSESDVYTPITKMAKQFLINHNFWFPQAESLSCSRCHVWVAREAICHCSLSNECFPCAKSRLKALIYSGSGRFWNSSYNSHTQNNISFQRTIKRRHSLPAFPQSFFSEAGSMLWENIVFPELSADKQPEEAFPLQLYQLLELVDLFFINTSLAFKFLSSPFTNLSIQTILNAESLIPCFVRLLPVTHYVIFLHGFYGTIKDYRKFLDLLLYNFPDVHCFLPDCYSNKATVSIPLVAEAVRSYLLTYTPQPLGSPRLPRSPDLFVSLTCTIHKEQENTGVTLETTTRAVKPNYFDTTLVRLPGCRYLMGVSPYYVVKSRVFISLIGHSLGGIIARSLVAHPELRFDTSMYSSRKSKSEYHNGDISPSILLENNKQPLTQHVTTSSLVVSEDRKFLIPSTDILQESVMLLNFVTFASPHNGIFENFIGIQAFSYILPAARNLSTASPELMELASPSMVLPLSHFHVLAIYGNVCNDFLVGPLTSLLINPKPLYELSGDDTVCDQRSQLTSLWFNKFPLCVVDACIKSKNYPVELDLYGYILNPDDVDYNSDYKPTSEHVKCPIRWCIHHLGEDSSYTSSDHDVQPVHIKAYYMNFVKKICRDSRRLRSSLQLAFPLKIPSFMSDSMLSLPEIGDQDQALPNQQSHEVPIVHTSPKSKTLTKLKRRTKSSTSWKIQKTKGAKPCSAKRRGKVKTMVAKKMDETDFGNSPFFYVRYLSRLNWRRFAVFFKSTLRAHSCITWHGRLDPGNSGKYIIQHFLEKIHLLMLLCPTIGKDVYVEEPFNTEFACICLPNCFYLESLHESRLLLLIMVTFEELNSSATELLNQEFCHDKPWVIHFKHSLKNPTLGVVSSLDAFNVVRVQSFVKYNFPYGALEMRVGTHTSAFDGTCWVPNVKNLVLRVQHNQGNDMTSQQGSPKLSTRDTKISASYSHEKTGLNLCFVVNPFNGKWNASSIVPFVVSPCTFLRFGTFSSGSSNFLKTRYGVGMALTQKNDQLSWTGTIKTIPQENHMVETVLASVSAKGSSCTSPEYAACVQYSLPHKKTQVSFAGLWYLDPFMKDATSGSMLKLKMTHDGKVSAVLKQKVSETLTASFGAQLSLTEKTFQPLKYGIRLNLTA